MYYGSLHPKQDKDRPRTKMGRMRDAPRGAFSSLIALARLSVCLSAWLSTLRLLVRVSDIPTPDVRKGREPSLRPSHVIVILTTTMVSMMASCRRPPQSSSPSLPSLWWSIHLLLLTLCNKSHEVHSLSVATPTNPRFVCLIHSYDDLAGPQLTALLHGLHDQASSLLSLPTTDTTAVATTTTTNEQEESARPMRIALLSSPSNESGTTTEASLLSSTLSPSQLCNDLGAAYCQQVDCTKGPNHVREALASIRPTVLWCQGQNAHLLRHFMRATDLDSVIEQQCGPAVPVDAPWVYVGVDAGAICAGASVRSCRDDPSVAPEPQYRGLELLGPDQSFYCCDETDNEKDKADSLTDWLAEASERVGHSVTPIRHGTAFVWAQANGRAQSFFVDRRGSLERVCFPSPVPPLCEQDLASLEGRKCTGEPAIDPSRAVQSGLGDSEWVD